MDRFTRIWVFLPLLIVTGLALTFSNSTASVDPVITLSVNDVIGPATDDYIERSLQIAAQRHAELVVIQVDTPGGLDISMRRIIKNIIKSPVPIATYVSPSGARAASAGTYILYASHIAAMAPGTNLGAATPVQIGGIPTPERDKTKPASKPADDKAAYSDDKEIMKSKVVNDAAAYIRGLAQLRSRNEEWAEQAVRQAVSLPAEDALKKNVIDILAINVADLLTQIEGREIMVQDYKRVLHTAGSPIEALEPDWRSQFLSVITNPNVAYILMLIGIYGLIFELSNPGFLLPGTLGAICLLLALYSFQMLPINYAGMALILLGVGLMVGEAYQPSFGVLGIGGLVAFVVGSIILMDTDAPGFGIDLSVIAVFAIFSLVIFMAAIGMALRAFRRPVVSGMEELIGAEAMVTGDFEMEGRVLIHSESWVATSDTPLRKGQAVKVKQVNGLCLQVEPLKTPKEEA